MGQSSQPWLDPLVGSKIGRYVIQARIGEGGMGTVYRAEQTPLGRPVALKVIHRTLTSDQKVVSRFMREAKIACQLTNPHTITIFDFGNEDGVLYLAMELLQGESLHERLLRGPVEPQRAAEIAAQVCRSLTQAHKKGIIHRDLKPDNIFLSAADDGSLLVKVLDYGLARVMSSDDSPQGIQATLTQIGTIVGTPIYMSPEQARGRKLDTRTDLYSMGIVLFEMLSGVAPFLDEDAVVVLGKHIRDPVPRIETRGARVAPPPALQVVVDKLLEKEPSRRPPDAAWVYQELRAYLSQATGSTRLPAVEESSAPIAAPPRITPPDADSGVQPRAEDEGFRDSAEDWEKTAATPHRDLAREVPPETPPDRTPALQPTLFELEAGTEPPADLPADPPTAPNAVPPPLEMEPTIKAPLPAPPRATSVPGAAPGPSLSFQGPRRLPLLWLAIGVPVALAALVVVATTLGGGDDDVTPDAPEPTGTTPPAAPHPASPGASVPAPVPSVPHAPPQAVEPATPPGLRPRVPPPGGWEGSFVTSRGTVQLTEQGGAVTSRFGDGGTLEGRPEGSVLRFEWRLGSEQGHGMLRSFTAADGSPVLLGSWDVGDPLGEQTWAPSPAPAPQPVRTGRRLPRTRTGKRPGQQGLIYDSNMLFGPRRRHR